MQLFFIFLILNRFLGAKAVSLLNKWFMENKEYPYPDETTTNQLAKEADISAKQVKKWFANKRVRSQLCCKPIQRNRKKRRMPNGNGNEMAMMMMTSLDENKNGKSHQQAQHTYNQISQYPNHPHLNPNNLLKQNPTSFMNPFLMMNFLANQQQMNSALSLNQNPSHHQLQSLFNSNPAAVAHISSIFQQQQQAKCFPNASSITGQTFAQMMLYHLDQSKKAHQEKLNQQQQNFHQQEEIPKAKGTQKEETRANKLIRNNNNNNDSILNDSTDDQTNVNKHRKSNNFRSSMHLIENISESSEREEDEDEDYMIEDEEVLNKDKNQDDEYYEEEDDGMNEDEGVHDDEEEEVNHDANQTERSDASNENLTYKNKLLDKMMLLLSNRSSDKSENKKITSDFLHANSSSTSSAAESAISVNSYLNDYSSLCNIHYSSTTSPSSSSARFASSSSTSSSSSASSSSGSSGSSPLSNSSQSPSSSNNHHSAKHSMTHRDLNSDDLINYFQTNKTLKFPQHKNGVNQNELSLTNSTSKNNNNNNKQMEKKINFAVISTLID